MMRLIMRSILPVVAVAITSLAGCTSTRQVLRSDIVLKTDATQTREGLTMEAKVVDLQSMRKDARLYKEVPALRQNSATGQWEDNGKIGWLMLNPPAFELRVTNGTDHVVKMTGIVIKLMDAAGNLYEASTKDKMAATQHDVIAGLVSHGTAFTAEGQRQIDSAVRALKLLDGNAELLPNVAETFFLSFELGVEPTEVAVNQWLGQQASLRVKIFEVPTQTNEAGAITKRTAFEFPVEVKTVRETYEVNMLGGRTLLSSEVVSK